MDEERIASATREIHAPAGRIFELIADPARQPEWDGNLNLGVAAEGQRVRATGEVFVMTNISGAVRENHVTAFDEGCLLEWKPAEPGQRPVGHIWRWELAPQDDGGTRVTHTYDWTDMHDESRLERARSTTSDRLMASIDRLAALAEGETS